MEALREKMETCCRDLRAAPLRVRRLIGLQRVAPVAIEVPAWYFRLEEAPGAYLLECVASDLFHTLVRMFVFHLRSIPAVWTAGTGWQAISFLPAPHLNGGAVRQPLPVWQELLRVSAREAGEESHGCRTASPC